MERLKEEYIKLDEEIKEKISNNSIEKIIEKYKHVEITKAKEDLNYMAIKSRNYYYQIAEFQNQMAEFEEEMMMLFYDIRDKEYDSFKYKRWVKASKYDIKIDIVEVEDRDLIVEEVNSIYRFTEEIIRRLPNYIHLLSTNKYIRKFYIDYNNMTGDEKYYFIDKGMELREFMISLRRSVVGLLHKYHDNLIGSEFPYSDSITLLLRNIDSVLMDTKIYSDNLKFNKDNIKYRGKEFTVKDKFIDEYRTYYNYKMFLKQKRRIDRMLLIEDPGEIENSVFLNQMEANNKSMYESYMNEWY